MAASMPCRAATGPEPAGPRAAAQSRPSRSDQRHRRSVLAEGQVAAGHSAAPGSTSATSTRHPYGPSGRSIERILAGWVRDGGPDPLWHRGDRPPRTTPAWTPRRPTAGRYAPSTSSGATALSRSGKSARLPGWDPTTSSLLAEVEMTEELNGVRRTPRARMPWARSNEVKDGEVVYGKGERSGSCRPSPRSAERAHPARSKRKIHRRLRTDFGSMIPPGSPVHRCDATGRGVPGGRILLAGDAPHVHSPVGGQGLNTGVLDA